MKVSKLLQTKMSKQSRPKHFFLRKQIIINKSAFIAFIKYICFSELDDWILLEKVILKTHDQFQVYYNFVLSH